MKQNGKRNLKRILLAAVAAAIAILISMIADGRNLHLYMELNDSSVRIEDVSAELSDTGVAELKDVRIQDDVLCIDVYSLSQGETFLEVQISGEDAFASVISVDGILHIYDSSTGNIGAFLPRLGIITIAMIVISIMLLLDVADKRRMDIYSYRAIYYSGFAFFILSIAISLTYSFVNALIDPARITGDYTFDVMIHAESNFMMVTSPFILIFAVMMLVSNISLMRHESVRLANAMGILISFVMVGAMAAAWFLGLEFSGSELELLLYEIFYGSFCMAYVYFECMLIGSILCGLRAARCKPPYEMDYIVILGCKIKPDGTLYPLIKGRVDRAAKFYRKQVEKTGKAPILIPTGAKGRDEVCSEAEAMKNYLLSIGIPQEHIIVEDQAKNTFQNMQFSKEIIEKRSKDARCAFSTTNYHVFRSGLWSRRAGFYPEGMGAKTKWYFWPNAFAREVIGLLQAEKKRILVLLLAFIAAYIIQVLALY